MANDSIGRIAHEMRDAASDVRADDFDAPATLKLWAGRLAALQQAQQPGAQAAWPSGLLDRVKAAEQRIENGHAPRRIPADPSDVDLVLAEVRCLLEGSAPPFWLKSEATAPPPLPEGVSEEDVTALVECLWDVDIGYEEAKRRARMILESSSARLAARGEKGVQGG